MNGTIDLMAAPTSSQPGGYVRRAYADRDDPTTPQADLSVSHHGGGWRVGLRWACDEPVRQVNDDPGLFTDAAALLAPQVEGANWATMGEPGMAVEGVLWRADRESGANSLQAVHAEGLGTVTRGDPRPGWKASAEWNDGFWNVDFVLPEWSALDSQRLLAVAIWRGSHAERGGIKSISQGWLELGDA